MLTDEERAVLRERMVAERELTEARIAQLTGDFDAIVEAAALDAPDDEHDPEGSTVGFERAQVAALVDQARTHLADLDQAFAQLEHPAFGTCTGCGRPIGFERLRARPGVSACVDCAPRRRGSRRRR